MLLVVAILQYLGECDANEDPCLVVFRSDDTGRSEPRLHGPRGRAKGE